jgi:hypothetical protein
MMTRCALAFVVVAAFGCGGGEPADDQADAPPAARACDGRAYDKCMDTTNSSDCDTGLTCRFYMSQNFTICSPLCDTMTTCPPDEMGTAVACNMMGRCRSNAPNNCSL